MTHRTLSSAWLAALLFALAPPAARAQADAPPRVGPCRLLRVPDSDAADLACGRELVRVRLRNVAAPAPGQVGHAEAARALAELLRARELYLAADPASGPAPAPGGRRLAYVYDARGANLNVAFVLLGWATYSADAGSSRLEASFRAAEREARSERRALWTVWSVSADGSAER